MLLEDLEQAGSIPYLYPPSLSPVMQLIDAEGRALVKQLQNSSEIYAKIISELTGTRGHWNKATANKSNLNDLKSRGKDDDGSSSDEDDDEYGEGEGDDYGSSGIDSDTSNSDDEDIQVEGENEGEEEKEEEKGRIKRRRGGSAKGKQERNSVISQRSKIIVTFNIIYHTILHYTTLHFTTLSRNVMIPSLCMCMY